MATLFGTSLVQRGFDIDGGSINLAAPEKSSTIVINGVTYLYVPLEADDAVKIYSVDADGQLTFLADITDSGGLALDGARWTETFEVDGNPFLAVAGGIDDGVSIFALTGAPPYATFTDSAFDDPAGASELNGAWSMAVTETPSNAVLTVAGYIDAGISTFTIDSTGTLTHVNNFLDSANAAYTLNLPFVSRPMKLGLNDFIAVGSNTDEGLTIFRVNSDGTLTDQALYDGSADGVRPLVTTGVEANDKLYIFASDIGNSAVHLFEFSGSSVTLLDTVSGFSLTTALGVQTIQLGSETYFAVASLTDGGITLFKFDPNFATITPVETLTNDDLAGQLVRTHISEVFEIGGKTFIAASGQLTNTIHVLEIGGNDDTIEGTTSQDFIYGGDGDDTILGAGGADRLYGEEGDDFINAGSFSDWLDGGPGDDVLIGGSANDIFFVSTGNDTNIGGSGTDTISAFDFDTGGAGITIDFLRGQVILPDGTIQSVDGIEDASGSLADDRLIGDDLANRLYGVDGNDLIRGRAGNDQLFGGIGEDVLTGADGDDFLFGENGRDTMNGGAGNDYMDGGGADDRMFAGSGDDQMLGGSGNDLMKGNDGNDTMIGDVGNDRLEGQQGDDTLNGGGGTDILIGGGGRDILNAGSGLDTMTGGSAQDTFVFNTFANGGGGNNTITDFKDGTDLLDVSDYGLSAAAVLNLAAQNGANVEITFADGQIARLQNFQLADLDASDLIV